MGLNRRQMLVGSAVSFLGAGLPFARARSEKLVGPRYVVVLFLRGGMDAVYTTDPKTRAAVDSRVDVPYGPAEIVDAGALQFGPHFARMKRWAPRMAVVRGVQVRTANHESGALQMLRMKAAVSPNMPALLDIIGQSRQQPLANVTIGRTSSLEHSPGALGGPTGDSDRTVLDILDEVDAADHELLARTYRRHLKDLPRWSTSPASERTRDHLEQAAAFFEKMKDVKPFDDDKAAKGRPGLSRDLARTLWLLENDLTRGVFVKAFLDWDSHYNNARKQTSANTTFVDALDRFLEQLDARRNAHGRLSDQTLLVMGSELGRFPLLNTNLGKDHFPETTMMFMGPHVNTNDGKGAAFVPTGKHMEGMKVSLATGQPDDNGTHIFLDDVGTTLLAATGFNPELYGYRGRRLRFLERT